MISGSASHAAAFYEDYSAHMYLPFLSERVGSTFNINRLSYLNRSFSKFIYSKMIFFCKSQFSVKIGLKVILLLRHVNKSSLSLVDTVNKRYHCLIKIYAFYPMKYNDRNFL